jgi:hypothetical protein
MQFKHLILLAMACVLAFPVHAETAKQRKLKACAMEAKAANLAGSAYREHMKSCRSAKATARRPFAGRQDN